MESYAIRLLDLIKSGLSRLKRANHRFQFVRWFILAGLTITLMISFYCTALVKLTPVGQLGDSLKSVTTIYDQSNNKIGEISYNRGDYTKIDKISPYLKDAVISTEDKNFYSHRGFSLTSMARAGLSLVTKGMVTQGGSTVTQQLAKNSFLTQDQTFWRKIKEFFYAVQLEKDYSKDQILEMYLNTSYFGNGVYGVQDASLKYFGKNASDLTVAEAATIAGMLKGPNYYNPIDSKENAINRRNLVLELMAKNNVISADQLQNFQNKAMVVTDRYQAYQSAFSDYNQAVLQELKTQNNWDYNDIATRNLSIYTYLDYNVQSNMKKTYKNDSLFPNNAADNQKVEGAGLAMDPKTGAVLGVVGSRGKSDFNRAIQMKRQPGSTMKPLAVYTPALQNGYQIDSKLQDKLQSYGSDNYTPKNVDNQYSEEVPLYQALAQSKNAPAVWLLNQIGLNQGIQSVKNFGINLDTADQNLALALGGLQSGVSLLDMARAYSAFANEGQLPDQVHAVKKVVGNDDKVLIDNTQLTTHQIMTPEISKQMTSLLLNVFDNGTGKSAKPSGYRMAGKTGTTEVKLSDGTTRANDQWIIGYTPDIVLVSWIGFDRPDDTHYLSGTSETQISYLFKQLSQSVLPYTDRTSFSEKNAQQLVSEQDVQGNSTSWVDDLTKSVQNVFDGVGQTLGQWYNGIRDKVMP
ncbi:transglycosylase domain-containing protein [Holzapfeliella sp. JNUCC 80]